MRMRREMMGGDIRNFLCANRFWILRLSSGSLTPLQSSFPAFCAFAPPVLELPLEPLFALLPSRFSRRSDILASVLDPEEEREGDGEDWHEEGDGGEQVGDLMVMRGALGWWGVGDGDVGGRAVVSGSVGVVECEGESGVGTVGICWPAGGWRRAAASVCVCVCGWRLGRAGGEVSNEWREAGVIGQRERLCCAASEGC